MTEIWRCSFATVDESEETAFVSQRLTIALFLGSSRRHFCYLHFVTVFTLSLQALPWWTTSNKVPQDSREEQR